MMRRERDDGRHPWAIPGDSGGVEGPLSPPAVTAAIRLFDYGMTRALRVLSHVLDGIRALVAACTSAASSQVASGRAAAPSFDTLQLVLRLAAQCPPGRTGDDIRRAVCELIETNSPAGMIAARRRLLSAIARVDARRARGRSRSDDPGVKTTEQLAAAVRGDLPHRDPPPRSRRP